MSKAGLVTPSRPKVIETGSPALDFGIERYIVKAGGSAVLALEPRDVVDIVLLEGGQSVEIVVFAPDGKGDLGALGLRGRAKPHGLQAILAGDRDDAHRVRFGLFRRGLDMGRATAARVFGRDTPPGETLSLTAIRSAIVVIGAPVEPWVIWDQTSPSDVLVSIQRNEVAIAGSVRLPEPLAAPRLEILVNVASAEAFEVSEAGICFAVATKKAEDYIGKAAIERRRAHPARKLVGLEIEGNEKASHGDPVFIGRANVGVVTSAMRSPILKKTIALARLDVAHCDFDTAVEIGRLDGHQKRLRYVVVRHPHDDPEKARVRA